MRCFVGEGVVECCCVQPASLLCAACFIVVCISNACVLVCVIVLCEYGVMVV